MCSIQLEILCSKQVKGISKNMHVEKKKNSFEMLAQHLKIVKYRDFPSMFFFQQKGSRCYHRKREHRTLNIVKESGELK